MHWNNRRRYRYSRSFFALFSLSFSIDVPLDEKVYPFVLTEEGVNYSFRETLNCQFVIAGNVNFLDDNTVDYENIAIMVQPLATYDDRPAATIDISSDTRFGANGWSQLLVGNYWYLVWVQDLDSNTPLSENVLVDNLNCPNGRILALVNFQQVLPLR